LSYKELPENVFNLTTENLKKLSPDVKAVMKRCAVCVLHSSLVDAEVRTSAKKLRREKAQALMADAFE